jgi:poly(3-hydroxyalkanoate) synthetase
MGVQQWLRDRRFLIEAVWLGRINRWTSVTEKAGKPERNARQERLNQAWLNEVWWWPLEATTVALNAYSQWFDGRGPSRSSDENPLAWTTPNAIALRLPSMWLRDFSRGSNGPPVLICAPYALHGPLIADFAPDHSLVQALRNGGMGRIYLTDWRSATPEMRYLSIDNYLADLNVAIDEIGAPVDLAGLCQGGWLSLVYAARFPGKVRRLVLAGSPIDVSFSSGISAMTAAVSQPVLDQLVRQAGGIVSGQHMLRFWSVPFGAFDAEAALQRDLGDGSDEAKVLLDRFERWQHETLDLPGTYYLETADWIFRENRIAKGQFVALGRKIDLAAVKIPVFLLASEGDVIVPAAQVAAAARLLGTQLVRLELTAEPCAHLGLFMGRRVLSESWRRIARWLQADIEAAADKRISA